MSEQLNVARLFDGSNWFNNVCVSISNGCITGLATATEPVLPGILAPGFIDIQVNGGGGALFNTAPTPESLQTMVQAHSRFGSTALLPTVITDSVEVMQQSADAIAAAITAKLPGVLGVHFEGPHLSVPKRGIHPTQHIRALSAAELSIYARTDLGIKLVTVAPENISPEQIHTLTGLGVIVCLGHSNADAETVQAAIAAGARGFTHLYNAMSPLTSREPGMVGVALLDPDTWCGVIFDGHHMHPLAAKVALAAKPKGKLLLVTDAMSPVGTADTEFEFADGKVFRQGNKLISEEGKLAGSVLDMAGAVQYAIHELDVAPAEALRMASLYPAQFLQLADRGRIAVGQKADLVLLNQNWQVERNWISGAEVFRA